ncbi:hypothetical protein DFJ63DRAFT_334888 [Scheffersomyces coipomensis]|uniref:uncharacterized protein n=1 Tax=Scheffersomyces coipomensis TaxID=1788519 RepID=UPI00315C8CA6
METMMGEVELMDKDSSYASVIGNLNTQLQRLSTNTIYVAKNMESIDNVCYSVYRLLKLDKSFGPHIVDSELVPFLINAIVVSVKTQEFEITSKLLCHLAVLLFKYCKIQSSKVSAIFREHKINILFMSSHLSPTVKGIKKSNLSYIEEILNNFDYFEFEKIYTISCLIVDTIFTLSYELDKLSIELDIMITNNKVDNDNLFSVLVKLLELMDCEFDKEIMLLLHEYTQVFKHITTIESKFVPQLSESNLKLIKIVKSTTYETFISKYPSSDYSLLFEMGNESMKGDFLDYVKSNDDTQKLEKCFQFVLEVLDQGINQDYLIWNNGSDSLLFYLRDISKDQDDRLKFYTSFNKLNSKISLGTTVLYLNFIISLSLSSVYESIDFPNIILDYFKPLKLPPVSKTKLMLSPINNGSSNSYGTLQVCLIHNLKMTLWILEDEIKSLASINQYTPGTARYSVIFKLIELSFPSLISALIFAERDNENDVMNQIIRNLVKSVFEMIVNIEIKEIGNSLVWVSLINFANDVCYSDLRYVSMFYDMLGYLDSRSSSKIYDPLVRSGLQFFYSTFCPNNKSTFETWIEYKLGDNISDDELDLEIFLHDYDYLYHNNYEDQKQNSMIDSSNTESSVINSDNFTLGANATKQNYATNSARQQSIHVDQFGKI